jgi:hypothetical protein
MVKKKIRKFGYGGFADALSQPVKPLPGFASLTMAPSGQSGGAYGGLDTVNQGSQQIGQSLQTIGDALGKPGGGVSNVRPVGDNLVNSSGNIVGQIGPRFPSGMQGTPMKKGGRVKAKKAYKAGGTVKSSASKRADGCAIKGKTKGRMV